MNAPDRIFQSRRDMQAQPDDRGLVIDAVGVKGVKLPVGVEGHCGVLRTVATFRMVVRLPRDIKGTHMSRFIELLEAQSDPLSQVGLEAMLHGMLRKLDASAGEIEMRFPYFVQKQAPVSGVKSHMDCEVVWRSWAEEGGPARFAMEVTVPATSLCPCSKEISDYGAHNQRSHIRITAELVDVLGIEALIAIAQAAASCEVYGLLKRADERFVTERAYDNPKFVEDIVRDVALALASEPRVGAFEVEVENFESIHNHSAFARIGSTCPAGGAAVPG